MTAQTNTILPYKNPQLPVEQRVDDLLQRMTLDEKVGQMNQLVGIDHFLHSKEGMTEEELATNTANAFYPGLTANDLEQMTRRGLVSSFLHVLTLEEANRLQQLAMQSRLGIPLLIGIDAIHGNAKCQGNTVYPTSIGLACSFDTAMAERIARQTAREMRAMNMHWTFNPNVEVAHDARWGRCGETFGEDPCLVARMGAATMRGYQRRLNTTDDVLACVKHMVGGSQSVNGTNGAPCDVSERTLREVFFPPFRETLSQADYSSVMMSHNELNGTPCHTNRWLMQQVLRREWDFHGFVVSDWMDIEHCVDQHHTAATHKEAFRQAIEAGIDMHMHGPEWQQAVVELVSEGRIPESRIDESVRRILTAKFRLGLFEHLFASAEERDRVIGCAEHQQTALEAARQGIVLLKNNGLLPLNAHAKPFKNILVTGINANDQNIMGDWSEPQPEQQVWTVLRGLHEKASRANVRFVDQGWDPRHMQREKIEEAVAAAREADLNIVCCGEYMMRFRWNDRTCGEDTDRDNIDLVGLQQELIDRVAATGKPLLVIVISGRPLALTHIVDKASAVLYAWEPGQMGGWAIADIIYGDVNPSAKLAMTLPRSVGQAAVYYNHKASAYFHPVVCGPSEPLFPFGFGLSYTTYAYSRLSAEVADNNQIVVKVTVKNLGTVAGTEIVQLYVHDQVSSVARPVKELKDFCRVALAAGEEREVVFRLPVSALAFYDAQMRYTVEPGLYDILVGGSSRDCDLLKTTIEIK
ncbi:MAG: glycoside hydrolase family 3 C-terminal domain-containing protein [Prevotella sp.]|nr:glycoside hydrolase family 3 C-terminal domain-containing protein [Prevotella sp.]